MAKLKRVVYHEDEFDGYWKTREELTEFCCFDPGYSIRCEELVSTWAGYTVEELDLNLDEDGKNEAGQTVVVHFKERENPCGTKTIKQDNNPRNCCDTAIELIWDEENSVSTMTDNSAGQVYVANGLPEKTWKVSGEGFWLDSAHTKKELVRTGSSTGVYTSDCCGSCLVTVTDGCSTAKGYIKGEDGHWAEMPPGFDDDGLRQVPFDLAFNEAPGPAGCSVTQRFYAEWNIYRVEQTFCRNAGSDGNQGGFPSCEAACAATETTDELYSTAKSEMAHLGVYPEFISMADIFTRELIPNRFPPNFSQDYQICGDDYICSDVSFGCSTIPACFRKVVVLRPNNYKIWRWEC